MRGEAAGRRPVGLLAIVGATATGKSALAVDLAERLGGEVISADAFAVYRGLDVGTAKPTAEERRGVPHHLLDVKDPREAYSAGAFASDARRIARDVLSRGKLPILCGGTGFYVRAFFEGLFEGPTRDAALRAALEAVAERRGRPFLWRALSLLDPPSGAKVMERDAARAIRYLEVALLTGRRPSELFVERPGESWEAPAVKLHLVLPRTELHGRIRARFERTIASKLPAEVDALLGSGLVPSSPGFAAIGYRETAELLRGAISREEWEERVLRATRRFAKRQETWFRAERGLLSVPADRADLLEFASAAAAPLFSFA